MKTAQYLGDDFFYYDKFYDDEPDRLQESVCGIIADGLFTGTIEHGGKYSNVYYYIRGVEVSDDYGGEDERMGAVLESYPGLAEYHNTHFEMHYEWNEDEENPWIRPEFDGGYFYSKDLYGQINAFLSEDI